MLIFIMLLSAVTADSQLSVTFLDNHRPHIELRHEPFVVSPTPFAQPASAMEFLAFAHYFLRLSERNAQFRGIFPNHTTLVKQCWSTWVALADHGHPNALIDLIHAHSEAKYKLRDDCSLREKLKSAEYVLKKHQQHRVQPKCVPFNYKFDQITPTGIAYLASIIHLEKEKSLLTTLKFWDNQIKVQYTSVSQDRALDWANSMPVPVQDALVGRFKSLEAYFPDIYCMQYVTPTSSSANSANNTEGYSDASDSSIDEKQPFLQLVTLEPSKEQIQSERSSSSNNNTMRKRNKLVAITE